MVEETGILQGFEKLNKFKYWVRDLDHWQVVREGECETYTGQ